MSTLFRAPRHVAQAPRHVAQAPRHVAQALDFVEGEKHSFGKTIEVCPDVRSLLFPLLADQE